jgi:uncharacterized damage-inducible protein DinB
MSIGESLLPEFDQEMATTRKLLARVPSERGEWKPHEKSFSLGHLAQLVAGMPGWVIGMLTRPHIDLSEGPPYTYEPTEKLLATFDENVKQARAAIVAADDASFDEPWSLKHGENVLFTQPRRDVYRSHINHICHHRGQLSVYLRMVDVPLPQIYGPTADEKW